MAWTESILKPLAVADRWIRRLEETVLAVSVLLMAAVSIANVIGRNAFDSSLPWANEVNQTLLVLITFLGLGYGARRARHIRMSALYDPLPRLGRKLLMIVTSLATAALLLMLAWYAVDYVGAARQVGSVTPALQLPLYWVYVWVPVGLVLGALQYLLTALRNLLGRGVYLAFAVPEAGGDDAEQARWE